jgi:hypothetical protein
MIVTPATWIVGIAGIVLMSLLVALQLTAVIRPRSPWTVANVYGGSPDGTDPKAYFAFNQGLAWADAVFWGPIQIVGSLGMVAGQRWGFLLALVGSVPFWYSAIFIFIWDRDMGFRESTLFYWCIVWGIWPAFGVVEMLYCFTRLTL